MCTLKQPSKTARSWESTDKKLDTSLLQDLPKQGQAMPSRNKSLCHEGIAWLQQAFAPDIEENRHLDVRPTGCLPAHLWVEIILSILKSWFSSHDGIDIVLRFAALRQVYSFEYQGIERTSSIRSLVTSMNRGYEWLQPKANSLRCLRMVTVATSAPRDYLVNIILNYSCSISLVEFFLVWPHDSHSSCMIICNFLSATDWMGIIVRQGPLWFHCKTQSLLQENLQSSEWPPGMISCWIQLKQR